MYFVLYFEGILHGVKIPCLSFSRVRCPGFEGDEYGMECNYSLSVGRVAAFFVAASFQGVNVSNIVMFLNFFELLFLAIIRYKLSS